MKRTLKVLTPVAAGVALGLGLLYISSLFRYDPNGCGGCSASGRPFFWTITANGYGPNPVLEPFFALDLMFWLALSLTVAEALSHIAAPYVGRKLEIRRSKHSAISKSYRRDSESSERSW
jgi:hypothetical protein